MRGETSVRAALGAVIITFEMSYKIANTSWVQLAFSAILIFRSATGPIPRTD